MSLAVSRFQKLICVEHATLAIAHRESLGHVDRDSLGATDRQGVRPAKISKPKRFRHRNDDYFGAFMKVNQFVYMQPVVISSILTCGVIVIIWLSVREVLVGRLNSGHVLRRIGCSS